MLYQLGIVKNFQGEVATTLGPRSPMDTQILGEDEIRFGYPTEAKMGLAADRNRDRWPPMPAGGRWSFPREENVD